MKTEIHPAVRIGRFALALALLSTLSAQRSSLFAQGTAFTYQGRLTAGTNAANGNFDLRFYLRDALTAGNPVGTTNTIAPVAVTIGLFTVTLDFGAGIFTGPALWLEIGVRTNGSPGPYITLAPRQLLTPTPYAIYAATVGSGGLASGAYGNAVTFNNAANGFTGSFTGNGAGVANVNAATLGGLSSASLWKTTGNAGTTAGVNFVGTTDTQPLALKGNGLRLLLLDPNPGGPNLIGGAPGNFVAAGVEGATIAGGGTLASFGGSYSNVIRANYSSIGGGLGNAIDLNAFESTVAGGNQNHIQTDAFRSAIGGGYLNRILANQSVIGGGWENNIQPDATGSTIGGGEKNTIFPSPDATIGGGSDNWIQSGSPGAVIGGGQNNIASGAWATVGGGQSNNGIWEHATVGGGHSNTGSGNFATVGGGDSNTSSGFDATVGGGEGNTASGIYATVPGGVHNVASGGGSFAAGLNAHATHLGSFVWGGGERAANSSGPYSFDVLAIGGVNFHTDANRVGLGETGGLDFGAQTRQMINLYSTTYGIGVQNSTLYYRSDLQFVWYQHGVHSDVIGDAGGGTRLMYLHPTVGLVLEHGTYQNPSDRNIKTNFIAADARQLLAKVLSLPISTWTYTNDLSTWHIGPMAQDFHAAFSVGNDDKHISTVDEGGVALAAIQGLNQKLEEKDAEIQTLKSHNESLERRLDTLEKLFNNEQKANGGRK